MLQYVQCTLYYYNWRFRALTNVFLDHYIHLMEKKTAQYEKMVSYFSNNYIDMSIFKIQNIKMKAVISLDDVAALTVHRQN